MTAERMGVKADDVTRIYSELEPCWIPKPNNGCNVWIQKTFKKAKVTYSFEYGKTQASRDKGKVDKAAGIKEHVCHQCAPM